MVIIFPDIDVFTVFLVFVGIRDFFNKQYKPLHFDQ